ncbi:MAG: DUF3048 domain-containing protein [Actinomycetota bacterium]
MKSTTRKRLGRGSTAALIGLGLLLSACGSSSSKTSDSSAPPQSSAPDTTVVVTTSTPVEGTPIITAAAGPVFPLTGIATADNQAIARPALVVKIDNHPLARPQSGLNEADIVFEENVEQLTRFAAVFQSGSSDPVGPIRSGRTQDVAMLGSLNRPLFAWSGGNARVTAAIAASDLRDLSALSQQHKSAYFRSKANPAPHNLYSKTGSLFAFAPADAGPPPAQFTYRAAGTASAGDAVAGVNLSMDGVKVAWVWDAPTKLFLRSSDGKPHRDAVDNAQLSTNNVVVLYVDYKPSPADFKSPEAQTIGKGNALVFSDGKVVKATWSRTDRLQPFALKDSAGSVVALTPGRTFVELGRADSAAPVPAGADMKSVRFP